MASDDLQYDEFVHAVLDQLYANRTKHVDSKTKSIGYMFGILTEQVGQLGKAFADKDYEKMEIEVGHSAAILFEVWERVRAKLDAGKADAKTAAAINRTCSKESESQIYWI